MIFQSKRAPTMTNIVAVDPDRSTS